MRENEENEARRPLLANVEQPHVDTTPTGRPPPGSSNASPGINYDSSLQQAALLMAEAARNAEQALAAAAAYVNPNVRQREGWFQK